MHFPYNFIVRKFKSANVNYCVAVTPVLFGDADGLDCTGGFTGTLISGEFGTIHFTLESYGGGEWLCSQGMLEEQVAHKILEIYHKKVKERFEMKLYRIEVVEPIFDPATELAGYN